MKKLKVRKLVKKRNQEGVSGGFLLVFLFFFSVLAVYETFLNLAKSEFKLAGGHKFQSIAIHLADAAIEETLSQIRQQKIQVPLEYDPPPSPTPDSFPILTTVPVGVEQYVTTATVKIDLVRAFSTPTPGVTPTPEPVRDIEGNLRYQVESIVTDVKAADTGETRKVARGIKAQFVVVNFGRYLSYMFGDDGKSFGGGRFDGPYHCNGNVTMSGTCDWNNSVLYYSGTGANPFYDEKYTTVVAGSIIRGSNFSYRSQNNVVVKATGEPGFSTLPNSTRPGGTWIDGPNGGFIVEPPGIPFSEYSAVAHVVLSTTQLQQFKQYRIQNVPNGPGLINFPAGQTTAQIDVGLTSAYQPSDKWPVRINLNALGKGRSSSCTSCTAGGYYEVGDDYLDGQANYDAALQSTYGLVIFVDGDAAVWGRLPVATGAANQNKKVTIIATGHIQVIGDVLPSGSPYGPGVDSNDINPDPLVNNPTDDAIALLAGGNIYVNPWYRADNRFLYNPDTNGGDGGDLRLSAFLYAPNGVTGGDDGTPGATGAARGSQPYRTNDPDFSSFTFHGAIAVETSGWLATLSYSRVFDPRLAYNLSMLIPSGTSVTSWQELTNVEPIPTPTP